MRPVPLTSFLPPFCFLQRFQSYIHFYHLFTPSCLLFPLLTSLLNPFLSLLFSSALLSPSLGSPLTPRTPPGERTNDRERPVQHAPATVQRRQHRRDPVCPSRGVGKGVPWVSNAGKDRNGARKGRGMGGEKGREGQKKDGAWGGVEEHEKRGMMGRRKDGYGDEEWRGDEGKCKKGDSLRLSFDSHWLIAGLDTYVYAS